MLKIFTHQKTEFNGKKTLFIISAVIITTVLLTTLLPENVTEFGIFSLIPAIFLIIYIFATQRILEALILASLIGFIMVSRPLPGEGGTWITNTFMNFSDGLLSVLMSEDIAWLIIVCGLTLHLVLRNYNIYRRLP